eukprot:CAMPEP_0202089480 /NCGR_PEP_ID=MMETSP0964-20121228/41221_1 /ASSEMBLY_ACC=CAM_ASM_000500 /TAXON_ID=4773 /ORGANISM="Schizochytrium aggregatum, Strain ATCC28209" /LENGTH=69 /DNA_ID=CAMNT_0048657561 /DNA_START=45 /DNA_END=250 /DNA_ORIENTATION=-
MTLADAPHILESRVDQLVLDRALGSKVSPALGALGSIHGGLVGQPPNSTPGATTRNATLQGREHHGRDR